MKSLLFSIIASFLIFLPFSVSAQVGLKPNYANELNTEMQPQYPAPGERVGVNLTMYTENLDAASIKWYQDGVLASQGIGQKNFSFTAPAAGQKTEIEIDVTLSSGVSFSKILTIEPAGVDLIWEADSYVPPFYRGRALWAPQGSLHVVAMPTFGQASKLIYKWTVNGQVLESQSGYGRNFISIANNGLGGAVNVDLLATDPESNLASHGSIVVPPSDPSITFYENNPLYGPIFEKALTDEDMSETEITVLAYPFGLDLKSDLDYEWHLNDNLAQTNSSRSIILRKPEGVSGSANVSFQATNPNKVLQYAEGKFLIKFK